MKKFQVGVIGYGWAATAHIAAINATGLAEVVAVYSSRELDEAALQQAHGSPVKSYRTLEGLLAHPGLEVVDITSYPWEHADQAVAAAAASASDGGKVPTPPVKTTRGARPSA